MPTDVQISLQGISLLPEDRYVNTLHFDGDQWGESLADELWSKVNTFMTAVGGGIARGPHRISCYEPGPNPAGPYFSKEYDRGVALSGGGPAELACCLSYATVDDPEQSLPRRRGRIYLGPLADVQVNRDRPSALLREKALDYGQGIAQVGLASNVTWVLYSRTDNAYAKIESIWVDDAWDVQRRRGLAPTMREVRDVQ